MSVRKRTWVNAAGEHRQSWVCAYTDPGGQRRISTHRTKKAADAAEAQVKVAVASGTHTAPHASTTVDHACALFLDGCRAKGLERTSVEAYRQHLDLHVRPYLGRLKLTALTPAVVRALEDDLRGGRPAPGGEQRARSADMVRRVLRTFGTALSDAQERGLISRNVVAEMRGARRRGGERRMERRHKGRLKIGIDIPSPVEIKCVLAAAEGRWRPFLLVAIFTGLRASELRGLRWVDVDFAKREIHVRQRADNRGTMGSPKSEASERTVPLPPAVLAALREWKLACPKGEAGLVFPTATGRPQGHANVIQRGWQPIQIRAGVVAAELDANGNRKARYSGLHSLRHFFASWCINRPGDGGLGLPPQVVQERLGHSTIVLTMDRYGHLFPRGDDADESAAAERALLG